MWPFRKRREDPYSAIGRRMGEQFVRGMQMMFEEDRRRREEREAIEAELAASLPRTLASYPPPPRYAPPSTSK